MEEELAKAHAELTVVGAPLSEGKGIFKQIMENAQATSGAPAPEVGLKQEHSSHPMTNRYMYCKVLFGLIALTLCLESI